MNTAYTLRARKLPSAASLKTAAWIMRLNSAERTPAVDAAFQEWLEQSPEHRETFERGDELWETVASLPITRAARLSTTSRSQEHRPVLRVAVACAALIAITFLGVLAYQAQTPELATATGQQLALSLKDGTRVTLNTQTRLKVLFDREARRVELESGEALFDVAKDPDRPFVVRAGEHEVTALGTQFVVRYERMRTAVVLMEGQVSVNPVGSPSPTASDQGKGKTVLWPGERITLEEALPARLDRPELEKIVAWRRGQIAFENTPLSEAIEEVNRYSPRQLVLGEQEIGDVRISGLFRTGDVENFVLALRNTHPVEVREAEGGWVVMGVEP